jgi:predicted transcriptional regulator
MLKANLSYKQIHLYLEELISKRLISQDMSPGGGVVYRTTERGREFLLHYTHLLEFLEERNKGLELESSSPYINSKSLAF